MAILIMAGIILNVCVGALFYDPVEKHMKKILVPRSSSNEDITTTDKKVNTTNSKITSSIDICSGLGPGKREIAASLPIAIPMHHSSDVRDLRERRGSGSVRRATFQIGNVREIRNYKYTFDLFTIHT